MGEGGLAACLYVPAETMATTSEPKNLLLSASCSRWRSSYEEKPRVQHPADKGKNDRRNKPVQAAATNDQGHPRDLGQQRGPEGRTRTVERTRQTRLGAGVNVHAHSPDKNQGGTGYKAENNQLCTERPIRLPWRHNENRSDERDRKEHERPRRDDV